MKVAKASAIPSTSDPISHELDIRLHDELALSFAFPLARFEWKPIDSTNESHVKRRFDEIEPRSVILSN